MKSKSSLSSKRIEYVDICKALCMFLVIIGHSSLCNNEVKQVIYAFHMPSFFMIFGMLCFNSLPKEKGHIDFSYIYKKIIRLLIPCYFWGFVYIIASKNVSIQSILLVMWGSQASLIRAGSLSSLWFLPCMFVCVICFKGLINRINKNSLFIIIPLLLIISIVIPRLEYGYLFSLDTALIGISFCTIGYYSKPLIKKLEYLKILQCIGIISICLLLCFFANKYNLQYVSINNADMASCNYGNYLLYFLSAISGFIAIISFSILVDRIRNVFIHDLLVLYGKNTLTVLIIHKPIVTFLSYSLIGSKIGNMFGAIIISMITYTICIIISNQLKRYLPILIGEKSL